MQKGKALLQSAEPLVQDVKLILTGCHISLAVAFRGPSVILGLYTPKLQWKQQKGTEIETLCARMHALRATQDGCV